VSAGGAVGGVGALGDEVEVVQGEVAGAQALAGWVEIEVEGVDGVDLGKLGVFDPALDRAANAAVLLAVAQAVDDGARSEVVLDGAFDEVFDRGGHAGQTEPAQFLDEECKLRRFLASCHGGSP